MEMEWVTKSDEELAEMKALENLLIRDNKYIPVPASELGNFTHDQLRLFAHYHAIYQFPTTELIGWLQQMIGGSKAIEVGAGNGCIGRALGIPITDNKMQEWDHIKAYYSALTQPVITYGKDIEGLDALSAVKKYKPDIVIACWVTQLKKPHLEDGNMHGIDELELLKYVNQYILVGNINIHTTKEIYHNCPSTHYIQEYKFDWNISRQMDPTKNRIFVWSRK